MSYIHDSRTGVNSRALRTVEVFIPSRSGEVSTCFFTGAPTDLLVEGRRARKYGHDCRDWLGTCHMVITRRVTLESHSSGMSSPSTHILDHIVHLTPGSFHDTAEQFRQLWFKFVISQHNFFFAH